MRVIADCQDASATGWTVLSNDAVNLAGSTARMQGEYSLEFDKANGTANTKLAAAYRTIDEDLSRGTFSPHDRIYWLVYCSAVTDVDYAFVRIGTDASNYAEYRFADTSLVAGKFTLCHENLAEGRVTGTGLDWDDVDYICVGVAFDAETDTLADIKVNRMWLAHSHVTE